MSEYPTEPTTTEPTPPETPTEPAAPEFDDSNHQCIFCGKVRPEAEMQRATINIRGWEPGTNRPVKVPMENWYCADDECLTKDQHIRGV